MSINIPTLEDPTAWGGRTFSPAAPLDLASLQGAIVTRLASAFAGTPITVLGFPEQPQDAWWEEQGRIGFFLVAYKESKYSEPMSTSSMMQERSAEFEIQLLARQVAWADFTPGGVFQAMLQVAKGALTGYRPTGWRNAYLTAEGFSEQDSEGGIWVYSLRYRVITLEIKPPDAAVEAALARLKMLRFMESAGQTPVPVPAALYTFGATGVLTLPNQNVSQVLVINLPTQQPYIEGTDYTVQTAQGTLTALEGGAIAAGETVSVSYSTSDVVTTNESGGSAPFYPSN